MLAHLDATLDPSLADFIFVAEIDEGQRLAGDLFLRKYRHAPPDYPAHIGVFHRDAQQRLALAHYMHFSRCDDMALLGGACTDGELLRRLDDVQRAAIRNSGGLMLQAARYGLRKFGADVEAVFAHCGNSRAFDVLMQAGFQPTDAPHLLVCWPRLAGAAQRRHLIAKAAALGAF